MSLRGPGQNHEAGRLHVKPMDGGLGDYVREELTDTADHTILLVAAPTGHREQPSRFVNNDDFRIGINDFHIMPRIAELGSRPQSIKPRRG